MDNKRKQPMTVSPIEVDRTVRQRILSASPTTSSSSSCASDTVIKMSSLSPTPATGSDHAATDGSVTESLSAQESAQSHDPKSDTVPGYQISMHDLTRMVMQTMSHPEFQDTFAPIVASVLSPMVNKSIQEALKPLQTQVNQQQFLIESQQSDLDARKMEIGILKAANKSLETKVDKLQRTVYELDALDLGSRVQELDDGLDELEQYGRRNSLRFHNVLVPEGETDTDEVIVKLCKEKLEVEITKDDICRSHPVGKPNRQGKSQLICRFRNWKVKNSIFSVKRQLKDNPDKIFITEDLTRYRQSIVAALADAKTAGLIESYWTTDGRIFAKFYSDYRKYLIRSHDDLDNLIPEYPETYFYDE